MLINRENGNYFRDQGNMLLPFCLFPVSFARGDYKEFFYPPPPPSDGILVHPRGSQGVKLCIGIRWTLPTSKRAVFLKLRNKKTF